MGMYGAHGLQLRVWRLRWLNRVSVQPSHRMLCSKEEGYHLNLCMRLWYPHKEKQYSVAPGIIVYLVEMKVKICI